MKPRSLFWLTACLLLPLAAVSARAADVGAQVEKQYGVVDRSTAEGRRLNDRLDRIVSRMSKAVGFQPKSAKLLGGKSKKADKVVNAFALGDGRIYVTLGLMRLVDKDPQAEDEVAFVVGHEMTHVVEKHLRKQQKKAGAASVAAVLLGVLTRDRDIYRAANLAAAAYVSSYGRRDEYRADKGGLKGMHAAGYRMEAAVQMLKHLKEQGGKQNKFINGLFGSHPITENRIKRIQKQIADIRAGRDTPVPSDKELKRQERRARKQARKRGRPAGD